jgi:formate dehydrogenase major subunit
VHNTALALNVRHQEHPFTPKPYEEDMSNPFYRYDPSQCILCGQCVQACQTAQVNETLSIGRELEHPRVLWDGGMRIGGFSCVSCGHRITVCPCNALMEKSMLSEAGFLSGMPKAALNKMIDVVKAIEPEMGYGSIMQVSQTESKMREERIKKTKTVCTYCGVGCSYDVWTKDRKILKTEPLHGDANQISTCVKGKFGWDYVNHKDRLQQPLIREGNGFREATWEEALSLVTMNLGKVKQQYGPDSIAVIVSSKTTNEDGYLMQKFARAVIGTNNVDNCSRYCQSPATLGLVRTVGYGGDSGSIEDIGKSALVLIIGSNTAESHPVLATRVKRTQALRPETDYCRSARARNGTPRGHLLSSAPRYGPGLGIGNEPLHVRQWPRQTGVSGPVRKWRRRIPQEPGAVHDGVCRQDLRGAGRNVGTRRQRDCIRGKYVHSVGHETPFQDRSSAADTGAESYLQSPLSRTS